MSSIATSATATAAADDDGFYFALHKICCDISPIVLLFFPDHYGELLAKIMSKMVIISQVAQLAKKIDRSKKSTTKPVSSAREPSLAQVGTLKSIYSANDLEGQDESVSVKSDVTDARSVHTKILAETLDDTNKMKLLQLLGEWEEPDSGGLGRVSLNWTQDVVVCTRSLFHSHLTLFFLVA